MSGVKSSPAVAPDKAAVLTKAVLRAAAQLRLTNKMLAKVIGISEPHCLSYGEREIQA